MPAVFVNRDKHLDELRSLLVSVAGGQGAALVVDGGSGMGKTSLLGEFVRRAESGTGAVSGQERERGCRIVTARCLAGIGPDLHHGPIGGILLGLDRAAEPKGIRRLFGATRRGALQSAPELLSSLVPGLGAILKIGRDITRPLSTPVPCRSIRYCFSSRAQRHSSRTRFCRMPVRGRRSWGSDDVQNIDPSSLHVLHRLLHSLTDEPLGLVLSHAVGDSAHPFADQVEALPRQWEVEGHVRRRALDGLPDDAVAELVRRQHPTAPRTLPPRLSRLIAGHPVFARLCWASGGPMTASA